MSDHNLPSEYKKYRSLDPFPKIPPALLNSADIADYARALRLIDPFDVGKLKPASYEVPFSGTVHWWDPESNERRQQDITSKDQFFDLDSNAIAFVCPDTTFYLPDYIAFRFNLQITEVHRGLLLGTGPLVDPGFCGRLLIPLHNLTANKYTFVHGKGFIWIEFTKLSPNARWHDESTPPTPRSGVYTEFLESKTFLEPTDYFRKATGNLAIVSSIPAEAQKARAEAERAAANASDAKTQAERAASQSTLNLVLSVLAIVVTVVLGGYQLMAIFRNVVADMLESKTKASEDSVRIQLDSIQKELDKLKENFAKSSSSPKPLPPKKRLVDKPAQN